MVSAGLRNAPPIPRVHRDAVGSAAPGSRMHPSDVARWSNRAPPTLLGGVAEGACRRDAPGICSGEHLGEPRGELNRVSHIVHMAAGEFLQATAEPLRHSGGRTVRNGCRESRPPPPNTSL